VLRQGARSFSATDPDCVFFRCSRASKKALVATAGDVRFPTQFGRDRWTLSARSRVAPFALWCRTITEATPELKRSAQSGRKGDEKSSAFAASVCSGSERKKKRKKTDHSRQSTFSFRISALDTSQTSFFALPSAPGDCFTASFIAIGKDRGERSGISFLLGSSHQPSFCPFRPQKNQNT
jgi:hypothetical protein